ncbi:glycosyltransferase [Clostridium aciditolerans]|uniref:Glycosyltransferase n=1 Tax=Clostridium aciditolerans TaxID=339861 RepID=A0A934M1R0_9CLOT|nr:glycosyltransferase [Clostridium aciditolerans]MBI6873584.1 glycosyltransferase [Clostridium aciditolerans]
MMNNKPLMTVIILSYNNIQYIIHAIHSVIMQDYNNIQLVISDDCSEHFDEQKILSYINKHKRVNIKDVVICKNDKNLGTVKNINSALKHANGKYIKLLAADDQLYDNSVLTQFVKYLETTGVMIATSTCAVYDEKLEQIKYLYPETNNRKLIKKLPPNRLYRKLAVCNIIGGVGVCMRKDLLNKYGLFDDRYLLTEDLPTWLILSRNGVKIGYIDNVTVKYRLNGVSNGESSPSTQILKDDLVKIIDNEILPNRYMLTTYGRREVKFIRMNMCLERDILKKALKMLLFMDVIVYRKFKTLNSYLRRLIYGKLSNF